jgi:hypothetical protein
MAFGMLHECVVTANTYINSQLFFKNESLDPDLHYSYHWAIARVAPI